jgi:hypothetical protein
MGAAVPGIMPLWRRVVPTRTNEKDAHSFGHLKSEQWVRAFEKSVPAVSRTRWSARMNES